MRTGAIGTGVYPLAPMPVLLDLPGPSRRIRVEPLRLPEPAREPAAPPREAEPEREPAVAPEREPVPVGA